MANLKTFDGLRRLVVILVCLLLLASCSMPRPLVERIKKKGELVVITRNSPTTYYEDSDGLKGLEYELVEMFADELGVKVRYLLPDAYEEIIPMIVREEAHFAAAGLTPTESRQLKVKFTTPYQEITQQLIYRAGNRRPKTIEDTAAGILEVVAGSNHEEELARLKQLHPDLQWTSQTELSSEELLYLVKEQVIDYTIADSNEVSLSRRFSPELRVAFDITKPRPLAWAFPHADDNSLFYAANTFLHSLKADGTLEQIVERYYGHVERLGIVDTRTFHRHMLQRLPELLPFFKQAAKKYGLEWQLLAAIGYQESHWNPKAVSPTGVRGVMMLTLGTAEQLGVEDRTDPKQSILGGARYVRMVEAKLPPRIEEPDRIWLALAGYNVGFGHLEDARKLTQRNGGNPDKWSDVKQYLPLLAQKKYYKTLKHGYARGREPVNYVDNIRGYYDLLIWHGEEEEGPEEPLPKVLSTLPESL